MQHMHHKRYTPIKSMFASMPASDVVSKQDLTQYRDMTLAIEPK